MKHHIIVLLKATFLILDTLYNCHNHAIIVNNNKKMFNMLFKSFPSINCWESIIIVIVK